MASVKFKLLRMLEPGLEPDTVLFEAEKPSKLMMALQYHKKWEEDLLKSLATPRQALTIVSGIHPAHTKLIFKEFALEEAKALVEVMGSNPRFALMPIPWYKGEAVDSKDMKLEAWIQKTHN